MTVEVIKVKSVKLDTNIAITIASTTNRDCSKVRPAPALDD
jgi:hypothetical protein